MRENDTSEPVPLSTTIAGGDRRLATWSQWLESSQIPLSTWGGLLVFVAIAVAISAAGGFLSYGLGAGLGTILFLACALCLWPVALAICAVCEWSYLGTTFYGFLYLLGTAFCLASIASGLLSYGGRYRFLYVTPAGIRVARHESMYEPGSYVMQWGWLRAIRLRRQKFPVATERCTVSFVGGSNAGTIAEYKLDWNDLVESIDPAYVLNNVRMLAPHVSVDPLFESLAGQLEAPSYTDMWLSLFSTPQSRTAVAPLTAGQLLNNDRYRIAHALGAGGQGTAYLAVDLSPQVIAHDGSPTARADLLPEGRPKSVVLKEYILPAFRRRLALAAEKGLKQEAGMLRNLDHPQIVRLLDAFTEDSRGYLVLEYVEGQSLRELVEAEGPQPEVFACQIAMQICDILGYLHEMRPAVVHRDITPENLLLQIDGMVKLVDFNVAREVENGVTATVVGKHCYIPPEQFRGNPVTQSDIYALGCTLHFLLTGADPEPLTTSHPRQVRPAMSEELDAVVAKATAFGLDDRYETISALRQDLERTSGM